MINFSDDDLKYAMERVEWPDKPGTLYTAVPNVDEMTEEERWNFGEQVAHNMALDDFIEEPRQQTLSERVETSPVILSAMDMVDELRSLMFEHTQLEDLAGGAVDKMAEMQDEIDGLRSHLEAMNDHRGAYEEALSKLRRYCNWLEDLIDRVPVWLRALIGLPVGDPFVLWEYGDYEYIDPELNGGTEVSDSPDRESNGDVASQGPEQFASWAGDETAIATDPTVCSRADGSCFAVESGDNAERHS